MDIYAQNIMDHYKSPRNKGNIADPTTSHREANYSCGDIIEVDILLQDKIIKDVKFLGEGCAISQASASLLSEKILGKKKEDILLLGFDDMVKILGVQITQRRVKCALLGLLAVQNALLSLEGKGLRGWTDLIPE